VGSGTTLEVAKEIGLRGIGLDISYPYLRDQAMLRVEKTMPRNALDGLPMFEGIG
jgi:DNA modification methylase